MQNIDTDVINLHFKTIYLTGKKITFPIINHLITSNKLNDRQKKGDIYLEYENNSFTSISVKKNFKCTLTNYPTEKLAKDSDLSDIAENIKYERMKLVTTNIKNFSTLLKKEKKYEYDLIKEQHINKILHDSSMKLWTYEEQIINNPNVQQKIIEGMFPNVSFQNISYDGDTWKKIISHKNIQSYTFKRCIEFDTNKSAKIWYIIYIDNKLQYVMEIRGKNRIYGDASIQAFVYNKKIKQKKIDAYQIHEQL